MPFKDSGKVGPASGYGPELDKLCRSCGYRSGQHFPGMGDMCPTDNPDSLLFGKAIRKKMTLVVVVQ